MCGVYFIVLSNYTDQLLSSFSTLRSHAAVVDIAADAATSPSS